MDADLTPKQRRFVDEYLIDMNATAAYKRAGYKATGHSAESCASEILSNPEVQKAVQVALDARKVRTEITQDRVLEEYAKLAFLDPRRFFNEDGTLIPIPDLDAEVAASLVSVDVVETLDKERNLTVTTKKIRFADKKGALDSISRHLGGFKDKLEVSGSVGNSAMSELDLARRVAFLLSKAARKPGEVDDPDG